MINNNRWKVELVVLHLLTQKDFYCYEFVKKIKKLTDGYMNIQLGFLYPLLYGLESEGYISSYEVEENSRIRVYYHIEEGGYGYLEKLTEDYFLTHDAIKGILSFRNE